ncbi:Fic family protein [Stenotrophomonas geniculata]|uniref:Fic family protein n=1 Tax=Stenotrophomonas geniculata TaxID=86188 RepID=UPI003CCE6081
MYRRYVGREINVGLLIDLHRLGMPVGGGFRREEISVGKDDLENGFLATALNVRPFMGQLVNRINLMPAAPARVIAFAYAFLILHPFNDGNGRVFRMMCPILGARSQAPLWFGFSRSSKKEVGKFKRCMTHLSVGACEPMKEFLHMCIDACQRKGV